MQNTDHPRLQSVSLIFLAVLALFFVLHIARGFLVPFILGVFLASLFMPVADYLENKKIPGHLTLVIIFILFFTILLSIIFILYGAVHSILSQLPQLLDRLREMILFMAGVSDHYLQSNLLDQYRNMTISQITKLIAPASVMKTVNISINTSIDFFGQMILMMLFLLFIMMYRHRLMHKIYSFFSIDAVADDQNYIMIQNIGKQLQKYIIIKTLVSLVTGILYFFIALAFGLDFAIVWGFLAFILNFIPTIGSIIATILPMLFGFVMFDSIPLAISMTLIMTAVNFTLGNIVEPKIVGEELNLNIVVVLLSLFLWGLIFGIPGMLLAVPITSSINIICGNIPSLKRISILLSK